MPTIVLVSANLVAQATTAAGTGYTKRVITVPDNDILEDRVVSSIGSYSGTASLSGGSLVHQSVAFRAAGTPADTQVPTTPVDLRPA